MPENLPHETDRLAARLRFRHLQLITELQRSGSLRAAAQPLNLTQPALSKALREIETAFGFALFARTARGLTPTPQGAVVVRGAAMLLEELAHLHAEAAAGDNAISLVRIGAPPFVAQDYLPAVLARLALRKPPVRTQLTEDRVPLLLESLAAGKLDALVTSYPAQMPEQASSHLKFENLFDTEFVVIAAPSHPLTRARRVNWQRLACEPWVMPASTSMLRRLIDDSFTRAGIAPPAPLVESTSPVTTVRLVAAGLGLSAVPASTMRQQLALGLVKRIRVTPAIVRSAVALIYRANVANPRVALLRQALGLA
jgi:DNA-binding transcriptional LysR family regulator